MIYPTTATEYVILDTETTGLKPELGDALVEIAGQRVRGGVVIDEFVRVINPGIPCTREAAAVHGLSEEFIFRNGRPLKEVIPEFVTFCSGATLVGHNIIKFDLEFINNHLRQLGMAPLQHEVIDTCQMARKKLNLANYQLKTLAQHYNVEYSNAHRALRDVEITREVFYHLMGIKKKNTLF